MSFVRTTGRLASRWARINGDELHYLRSTGPEPPYKTPVILLHGIMSGASFQLVGERLAPYFRAYIPDMPGIGQSERPQRVPELHDLVNTLVTWMDRCGIEQAHIASQSFGCNLAVETAVTHPQRVASLTLQAVTLEPSRRSLHSLFPHWLMAELREIPKTQAKKRGQKGVTTKGNRALLKALLNHEIEKRLPLVQCPTLVLHGTHDLIVSRRWSEYAASLLPFGQLQLVPGGTHTMNARQPDVYSDAFLNFVGDLPNVSSNWNLAGGSHAA
jgi:2-hydroxy-6-oxonona-2,4-dienedioate hydrolase